MRTFVGATQR